MNQITRKTASDKVLRYTAFNVAKNRKYDGYHRGFMVCKVFDKNSKDGGANNKIKQNQKLSEELHKPIIKKFKRRRVYCSFKESIWRADLSDMKLISQFNKGVIDLFSKYAQVKNR